ncbi:MAG: sugar ABC transporter permease [Spirochaetota bacterium]
MVCLLLFYYYPIAYSGYLSFLDWNLMNPVKKFIGMLNYKNVFGDAEFIITVKNSVRFMLGTTAASIVLGLLLAVLLDTKTKAGNFFRSIYFLPYIISWVSVSLLWRWIFDKDWGLLNTVLKFLHLPGPGWLGDPKIALYSLMIVMVWKVVGYNMVICLAGLRNIPEDYYEAAQLDGASRIQCFRFITLPLLSPTLLFLLVTSMIESFTAFAVVKVMTGGGPINSTSTFVYYVYEIAFEYFRFGKASAAAIIFFVMILIITALQFIGLRNRIHYDR